ncbi:MAG: dimethylsulfonioproprionate lyase family protein [Chloroflexota bacterium]
MNITRAKPVFENLRDEITRFLQKQAIANPPQAALINTIFTEIGQAQLPDPLPTPGRLPGYRHLEAALDLAKAGPMADLAVAFARFEPHMRWIRTEHYREKLGDAYMENYCYTNVLGYDALIPHDRGIATFFIIGPGRHYPRHHHEAEEIYFPFGGDTLWSQNDEKPRTRPAGELIHNTPWLPHEMITRKTPLFTFCFWVSPGPIKLAQLTE